jgi:replication fork protection complex subunit Tof1/Swi1
MELVFKDADGMERDRQIAIVVGALLDKNQTDLVAWVKRVAGDAEIERKAWQDAERIRRMEEDPFDDTAGAEPKAPPVICKLFSSLQIRPFRFSETRPDNRSRSPRQ